MRSHDRGWLSPALDSPLSAPRRPLIQTSEGQRGASEYRTDMAWIDPEDRVHHLDIRDAHDAAIRRLAPQYKGIDAPLDALRDGWIRKGSKDSYTLYPGDPRGRLSRARSHSRSVHPDVTHLNVDHVGHEPSSDSHVTVCVQHGRTDHPQCGRRLGEELMKHMGWISPDDTFHPLDDGGHEALRRELHVDAVKRLGQKSEEDMYRAGWIRKASEDAYSIGTDHDVERVRSHVRRFHRDVRDFAVDLFHPVDPNKDRSVHLCVRHGKPVGAHHCTALGESMHAQTSQASLITSVLDKGIPYATSRLPCPECNYGSATQVVQFFEREDGSKIRQEQWVCPACGVLEAKQSILSEEIVDLIEKQGQFSGLAGAIARAFFRRRGRLSDKRRGAAPGGSGAQVRREGVDDTVPTVEHPFCPQCGGKDVNVRYEEAKMLEGGVEYTGGSVLRCEPCNFECDLLSHLPENAAGQRFGGEYLANGLVSVHDYKTNTKSMYRRKGQGDVEHHSGDFDSPERQEIARKTLQRARAKSLVGEDKSSTLTTDVVSEFVQRLLDGVPAAKAMDEGDAEDHQRYYTTLRQAGDYPLIMKRYGKHGWGTGVGLSLTKAGDVTRAPDPEGEDRMTYKNLQGHGILRINRQGNAPIKWQHGDKSGEGAADLDAHLAALHGGK